MKTKELVFNGTFNKNVEGWLVTDGGKIAWEKGKLKASWGQDVWPPVLSKYVLNGNLIPVVPNKKYMFKYELTTKGSCLHCVELYEGTTCIYTTQFVIGNMKGTFAFTAKSGRVDIRFNGMNEESDVFYIDNVSVKEIST